MNAIKILGIIIALLGVLALIYGGFTYVEDTHDADLGPVEFQIQEKETVNIPVWGGVAAVIVGAGMLLYPRRRPAA